MTLFSPEVQARIDILRAKVADGTYSLTDQQEAVRLMREDRKAASLTAASVRAKAKAAIPNSDDLLDGLLNAPGMVIGGVDEYGSIE